MSWLKTILFATVFLGAAFLGPRALAQLPFDPSAFTDPSSLLSDAVTVEMVRAIGLGADHRPYQPATPLGTELGLDIGVEATLFSVPEAFTTALQDSGLTSTEPPPSLPSARLHLQKGLTPSTDLGLSAFWYQDYWMAGGDLKHSFVVPDQGLVYAIRFSYSYANVGFVETHTWSPQVLVSRRLNFADPYIGIGYQYATGTVNIPASLIAGDEVPAELLDQAGSATKSGDASGLVAFLGVGIQLGPTGVKLSLGGSYGSTGVHTMGTKVGFAF